MSKNTSLRKHIKNIRKERTTRTIPSLALFPSRGRPAGSADAVSVVSGSLFMFQVLIAYPFIGLSQDIPDHVTGNIGEAKIPAIVEIGQPLMVQAHQVEDRGVQVMHL